MIAGWMMYTANEDSDIDRPIRVWWLKRRRYQASKVMTIDTHKKPSHIE
jgi:hypothetical protein